MKILHVIQNIDTKYGGPASVIIGMNLAQNNIKHSTEIWTLKYKKQEQNHSNIKINYYNAYFTPILFSFDLYNKLIRRIHEFDIIHIHGLYRFPVSVAAWQSRKANVPYIITPHGALDPFLYKQSRFGKWAVPLKRLYERLIDIPNLNHASAIHYTSRDEAKRSAFCGLKARPVIIPNGIDWSSFENLPAKGSFRNRIRLNENTPLVLFLGRINFVKGLDLLIPAFSQVLKEKPRARLALVGPDNEGYGRKVRQWCRELGIEDKVFFVDHLGPDEVRQAYVDADVFVLPSYTESFGMTVVEAMASACPVIISEKVNIWREVQADKAGLVTGLEPLLIADAICHLLTNKKEAEFMGLRGRRSAKERYNWPRIVEQLTQVYQCAINEHAALRNMRS